MPKYSYKCLACHGIMMVYHSFKEEHNVCDHCGVDDRLERLPSNFTILNFSEKQEIGQIVKKSIEELNDELKSEK